MYIHHITNIPNKLLYDNLNLTLKFNKVISNIINYQQQNYYFY